MPAAYKWHEITDLEGDPKSLTDGELDSLARVWKTQKAALHEAGDLEEFEKRLRREWSIETGIIENVYTLDRGVTRTLIEKGIDAAFIPHDPLNRHPEVVAQIIKDHQEALEGMFDFVGGQRELSTGYVKELHAALLRNQDTHPVIDQFGHAFEKRLEKGQYKTDPNSPTRPDGTIHEYCPPEHVAAEMDRLVAMHAEHEARAVPVEVEAAWLHHRFTQIHPFADGNGRVARAISSIVFIKAHWFPLIVKREDWSRYVSALEQADHGHLRSLISLFVEAQRVALLQASEAAHNASPPASPHEEILAARDRLIQRGKLPPPGWPTANTTASRLAGLAARRFEEIADELKNEIGKVGQGFAFSAAGPGRGSNDEIRKNAVNLAGHAADFTKYNAVVSLHLNAGQSHSLSLSFHGIGPGFGLIGVAAYLVPSASEILEGGTFQINYEEDLASAESRFSTWLERMILEGLKKWRETL
jgi:Fic family protein